MSLWSWMFLMLLVFGLPLLSARSMARGGVASVTRAQLYLSVTLSLWAIGGLGYLVMRADGQTLGDVFIRLPATAAPARSLALWSAALTVGGLTIFAAGQIARHRFGLPPETVATLRLRPVTTAETACLVLVVAPTAGVCEEFLYRGFIISRVTTFMPSITMAAFLAALIFAAAHLYQGWLGAARAGAIALLLAAPVAATGSILPAVLAHTLIDAVGIAWLWPRLDKIWPGRPGAADTRIPTGS